MLLSLNYVILRGKIFLQKLKNWKIEKLQNYKITKLQNFHEKSKKFFEFIIKLQDENKVKNANNFISSNNVNNINSINSLAELLKK